MVNAEDTHRWDFRTDTDGVQWVCKGLHDKNADCEWELASANLVKPIDLYDTPIDLRPVPKFDPVAECIDYLRAHGDHYGVNLLLEMQRAGQKDSENS